jgi:hypothetical protein
VVNDRTLCQWLPLFGPPKGKQKKIDIPVGFGSWLTKKIATAKEAQGTAGGQEEDSDTTLRGNGVSCRVLRCSALELKERVHPRVPFCMFPPPPSL